MAITAERREILSQAGKAGGMAFKHKWTPDELDIVRREYKGTTSSAEWLADYLTHLTGERITFCAVKGQVAKMGITLTKSRRWTPEEEERLAELITRYAPITVAKRLKRSVNSVLVKSKRMGLSRRCRDGWYTQQEAVEILGADHKKVKAWIDRGELKAKPHFPGDAPQKNGQHPWHIMEADLRDFIIKYPQELTGRNVDLIQIVNILVSTKE